MKDYEKDLIKAFLMFLASMPFIIVLALVFTKFAMWMAHIILPASAF